MAYYNVCPSCGSNLDPGEKCDCEKETVKKQEFLNSHLKIEPKARQLAFVFDGKEAARESEFIY